MNNKQRYLLAATLAIIAVVMATITLHFGYYESLVDGQGIRLSDPTMFNGALGIWVHKSIDYGSLGILISLIALGSGPIKGFPI
jgi:hypothetical protein